MTATIELRDVVRRFGPAFVERWGSVMLPSQKKALADIVACRTSEMGGRRYHCEDCGTDFWIYHACRNRACPACHAQRTREWVEARHAQLLGCDYFHVVATVPKELRAAFLADQKRLYGLLMKTVAQCVVDLVGDSRYVGGLPAVLATLHTWARDLGFHPHVHLLVSAGGLSPDGEHWIASRHKQWLVPIRALSALIRGRFREGLKAVAPATEANLPASVWRKGWNVFCKPCGAHTEGVVDYLGRYVFRTAISNTRIEAMDDTHVTFRFKSGQKGKTWSRLRLKGEEFLRRFVMHVLPRGFHRVRYYGLWHHSKADDQQRIAQMLRIDTRQTNEAPRSLTGPEPAETFSDLLQDQSLCSDLGCASFTVQCPHCSSEIVCQIEQSRPPRNRSP